MLHRAIDQEYNSPLKLNAFLVGLASNYPPEMVNKNSIMNDMANF